MEENDFIGYCYAAQNIFFKMMSKTDHLNIYLKI